MAFIANNRLNFSSASQSHGRMCSASPVSSERRAAILARAKKRKNQQSKLNATPEGAADTSEDVAKAQVAAKAREGNSECDLRLT